MTDVDRVGMARASGRVTRMTLANCLETIATYCMRGRGWLPSLASFALSNFLFSPAAEAFFGMARDSMQASHVERALSSSFPCACEDRKPRSGVARR